MCRLRCLRTLALRTEPRSPTVRLEARPEGEMRWDSLFTFSPGSVVSAASWCVEVWCWYHVDGCDASGLDHAVTQAERQIVLFSEKDRNPRELLGEQGNVD